MNIQIKITVWWALVAIAVIFLSWVAYRLIKRYIRKCPCGCWLLVKRIKMMEPDPDAPNDGIFGEMYFVYILGECLRCERVHLYKVYRKRFTTSELMWRRAFHSSEFNRPDSQALLKRVGIDLCGHSSGEKVGHKPQIQLEVNMPPSVQTVRTFSRDLSNHVIKPSR
jgi:hypothetical protein